MSFTFLAKSRAYSWKMSFDGQVLCQRMLTGPWALTTVGAATVAAAATAPVLMNLRRVTVLSLLLLIFFSSLRRFLEASCLLEALLARRRSDPVQMWHTTPRADKKTGPDCGPFAHEACRRRPRPGGTRMRMPPW